MQKRGKDMGKLTVALNLLASQGPMPERFYDHQLKRYIDTFSFK